MFRRMWGSWQDGKAMKVERGWGFTPGALVVHELQPEKKNPPLRNRGERPDARFWVGYKVRVLLVQVTHSKLWVTGFKNTFPSHQMNFQLEY